MTELSALHVKITGDAGDLKAATTSAAADIQKVGAAAVTTAASVKTLGNAAQTAQTKTAAMGGALGGLANMSGNTRSVIQNIGYQVSDMAVQFEMGTRATTIFAQQGPQILGAFGPVGAVLGALVAITMPALGLAFLNNAMQAKTLGEAVDNLSDRLGSLNDVVGNYSADGIQDLIDKYGELNAEVLLLIERQRQFAEAAAMNAARDVAGMMLGDYGSLLAQVTLAEEASAALTDQLGLTSQEAYNLRTALQQLRDAKTFEEQADALSVVNGLLGKSKIATSEVAEQALQAESAMRQLAAAAPKASWMSAAIDGVSSLGAAIRARIGEAVTLGNALSDATNMEYAQATAPGAGLVGLDDERGGQSVQVGSVAQARGDQARRDLAKRQADAARAAMGATGNASGASGGVDPMVAEVERLRQQLATKEQLEMESYTAQQEMLLQAYNQKLLTQEEYNLMLQNSETQHAYAMAQIKEQEASMVKEAARGMYGDLEGLLSAFGGKSKAAAVAAIALNKGLRIAEIIQNTAAAQMRAFAELGPIAGAAAAAKIGTFGKIQAGIVAATGLLQASGAGGGGGGGGGGSSAAAAVGNTTETRTANINFYGGFQPTQDTIDMIASGLNDWLGDGGKLNVGGAS
jgi:hypothetical protein